MADKKQFKPLQGMYEGINLNNGRISELIYKIESVFGKENINIVNIAFTVDEAEDGKENEVSDIISLTHRSPKDIEKNRVLIDLKRSNSLEKIINALDQFKEVK